MDQHLVNLLLIVGGVILVAGIGLAYVGAARRKRQQAQLTSSAPGGIGAPKDQLASAKGTNASAGTLAELPTSAGERGQETDELALDVPEKSASRLVRLRARLARSQSGFGKGLLALLGRDTIDEQTWESLEETLLLADIGPSATDELLESLRTQVRVLGTKDPSVVKELLRTELTKLIDPSLDRSLNTLAQVLPSGDVVPAVMMVVGVNGTGKTTTVGKLARLLVAEDFDIVLGAADTFRAAAAEQLSTWGDRVGVPTIRSHKDGADPAAVAFDAVKAGRETGADIVLIDTAGRLQNKVGLMDELGKVRRIAEKALDGGRIEEVLLVLDATTGQNGLQQAKVFQEVVNITGIVLTKLDGSAKGGIIVAVQRELGVPVKLIGLGEGADDIAPFEVEAFVSALLDD